MAVKIPKSKIVMTGISTNPRKVKPIILKGLWMAMMQDSQIVKVAEAMTHMTVVTVPRAVIGAHIARMMIRDLAMTTQIVLCLEISISHYM